MTEDQDNNQWSVGKTVKLETFLEKYIACQKRTSPNKQFAFIGKKGTPDGNYFWKGPFKTERYEKLIQRFDIIRSWNLPNVMLPHLVKFPMTPVEADSQVEGWFFRFDNLMKDYPIETDYHTESWEDGYSYKVLRRNTLMKVSDVLKTKGSEWIYDNVEEITYVMCAFYILGIGDLGLFNILADLKKKEIFIIDFEADRGKGTSEDREFFFFSKNPTGTVRSKWLERLSTGNYRLIEHLEALNLEDGLENKRTMVIKKYRNLIQENRPVTKERVVKEPVPKGPIQPEFQMAWKGQFGSIVFSGVKVDIAKSALQKFIRRGLVDPALQICFELYQFREIPEAKGIVTNLMNRLCVMVVEDIGPANLPLVSEVLDVCLVDNNMNSEKLYELIVKMCESGKTRICSHLARCYNIDYPQDLVPIDTESTDEDEAILDSDEFWHEEDTVSTEIRSYANIFLSRLKNRDRNAFTWGQAYLDHAKGKKVKARRRRTKAEIVLWEMLGTIEAPKNDKVFKKLLPILEKAFFTLSDCKAFWRLAVFLAIDGCRKPSPGIEKLPTLDEVSLRLGKFKPMKFPPFVVDVHTSKGRQSGADRNKFVSEGAHIENEDTRFDDPLLKRVYEM